MIDEQHCASRDRLLVLCAMDAELKAVLAQADFSELQIASPFPLHAWMHQSEHRQIFVLRTGVGLANSAGAFAVAQDKLCAAGAVMLGLGGAISPAIACGTLVLAGTIIQHDSFAAGKDETVIPPGAIHLSRKSAARQPAGFAADALLLSRLQTLTARSPELAPKTGLVLSGSEFAGNPQRRNRLAERFPGALLIDMESAGAALVAQRMRVPFLCAKIAADTANDTVCAATFRQSSALALKNLEILARLILTGL